MINKLIDTFEDLELDVYQMQVDKLLQGIVLDYSFIRIDPFQGIKRKDSVLVMEDMDVYSGFYSFLIKSSLFSTINVKVRHRINFEKIILFLDEQYEFQVTSGKYQSKVIQVKIDDLKNQSIFDEDALVLALIKNKNIKIHIRLKEKGRAREKFEENCKLDNPERYPQELLEDFKKIKDYQIEDYKIKIFLTLLGINVSDDVGREDLYRLVSSLNLRALLIEKSTLFMETLNKAIIKFRHSNDVNEQMIKEDVEFRFKEKHKALKELEYKLKAPFITLRDKND